MTKREEVSNERDLHRSMYRGDVLRSGGKGAVVGTALGAGLRHLGHAGIYAPQAGLVLGSALGMAAGHMHGTERMLKDRVQQERLHQRAEARVKKSYDETIWAGFADEVKQAGVFDTLGSKVIGWGSRAAKALGQGSVASGGSGRLAKAMTAAKDWSGSGRELARNVGIGTGVVGAGGLFMAGRASKPNTPYQQ